MKVSEMNVVRKLVRLNGEAILNDRNAVLVGVEDLTDEQGKVFDAYLTMFLKEHGLTV